MTKPSLPTFYVSELFEECASDLLDPDFDRWTEEDWLNYLNAGERQIIFFKPSSYVEDTPFQLVAGTRQSLPTAGVELIDITRNMGADGATAGASILKVNPKDLDECVPDWRSTTASATVIHFMFDPNDRTAFQVYPAQPAVSMGYVEAVYSTIPGEVEASLGAYDVDFNLNNEYAEPLKNYMRFRAYSVDAQSSQFAAQRALAFWNLFLTQIGRKDLIESRLPAKRGQHDSSNKQIPQ